MVTIQNKQEVLNGVDLAGDYSYSLTIVKDNGVLTRINVDVSDNSGGVLGTLQLADGRIYVSFADSEDITPHLTQFYNYVKIYKDELAPKE